MRIARTPAEIRRQLKSLRANKSIAFIPTMGCLHKGHISLIEKAKQIADIVVISIYVNPLQFGPTEGLDTYPRTFGDDARACADAGVDFIFHPATLYAKNGPKISLKAEKLSDCLCGASRPGHFDGVVTVVNMLFNIVQPDMAIFGEKDWQQLAIIRRMVADLHMNVEIIGAGTVREHDGLALSSRNRFLTEPERKKALSISKALTAMQQLAAAGEQDVESLKAVANLILNASGISLEYLDVRHARSLKLKRKLNSQPTRALIATKVGNTRLIDNMPLPAPQTELTS